MISLKEQYVVDGKGNRIGVFMRMNAYKKIVDQLEELESIRAYDTAKSSKDKVIPFEQAVLHIERNKRI